MVTIDLEDPTTIDTTNEAAEQAAELLEGGDDQTHGPIVPLPENNDMPLDTNCPTNETETPANETKPANHETLASGVQDTNTPESDVKEPQQQPETDICGDPLPLTDQQIAKQKAEADFRERIERLSKNVTEAAVEWTEAKDRAKSAKKLFDYAIEVLTEAADQGPCYMPLFDRKDSEPTTKSEAASEPSTPSEPEPDPNAWRLPSINEIGLKPKLAETLLEAGVETIGMLEDLRADISQGRKKWPKGIGTAKITQIEDAVIDWLSKNRDRAVIASVSNGGEQSADALQARAVELDNGHWDTQHPGGNQFWTSGYEASQRGLELRECPYVAGPEQDDWIRGWFRNENGYSNPTEQESDPKLVDLDDL